MSGHEGSMAMRGGGAYPPAGGLVASVRLPPRHCACSSSTYTYGTRAEELAGARAMRGVFVASRKGGDGVQGAPAPSLRCDYRLDIARARLHTHTYGTSARDYAGSRDARRVCRLAHGRRSGDVVPPPPSIRCRIIRDLYAICYTKTPQASACSQTPRFRRALRVSTNVRRRWGG